MVNLLKNCGRWLSYLGRFDESVQQLNKARDIAEKLAEHDEPTSCKAIVYHDLAKLLSHWKPYCKEATFYARKAIEMQKFLPKSTLTNMQIIDEKGEETPPSMGTLIWEQYCVLI